MTLDEAIKRAEEVVDEMALEYQECIATQDYVAAIQCAERAEDHRRLALWLKDYKRLLEQEEKKEASITELSEAQKTLYYIAENMKMDKSISEEGYRHFQLAIKALNQKSCEDATSSAEEKIGHWIIVDDCEMFIAKCSVCGRIEDSRVVSQYPYCHCGAKMTGSVQNG